MQIAKERACLARVSRPITRLWVASREAARCSRHPRLCRKNKKREERAINQQSADKSISKFIEPRLYTAQRYECTRQWADSVVVAHWLHPRNARDSLSLFSRVTCHEFSPPLDRASRPDKLHRPRVHVTTQTRGMLHRVSMWRNVTTVYYRI